MSDFLLLHGMAVGAWEWEQVVPRLQADPRVGKVRAPDFPGRGPHRPDDMNTIRLTDYLRTILDCLRDHDLRDVVLVAHSAGGICVQAAAAAEPERIRRLVFLCAAIPQRGRSVHDWQPLPLRLGSRVLMWVQRYGRRGIVPSTWLARRTLCAGERGLQPADCDAVIARLTPEPQRLILDRLDWDPGRVRAPATYILTTRDRVVRPAVQRKMAQTVPGIEIVQVNAGHMEPLVYPEWLASRLLSYAAPAPTTVGGRSS